MAPANGRRCYSLQRGLHRQGFFVTLLVIIQAFANVSTISAGASHAAFVATPTTTTAFSPNIMSKQPLLADWSRHQHHHHARYSSTKRLSTWNKNKRSSSKSTTTTTTTTSMNMMMPPLDAMHDSILSAGGGPSQLLSYLEAINLNIGQDEAEAIAGPFFGASLLPYLAFLYFLNVKENECPKGVTVGFATCLLFVFLTIPAAIAAKVLYGVSLADSDWLHGSAESLLTITNLVTVVAFRQALKAKEEDAQVMPESATSYAPMTWLVVGLTALAGVTAFVPALAAAQVHTPYLGGFMDLPASFVTWGNPEPENALTVATWIIHISSLVEFLVAMGFAWRWADVSGNPTWKGLTWGLIPLHSSGITACTYHLFYNQIPILVPLQAFLTCVGNTTAAYAAYRIAVSNDWAFPLEQLYFLNMDRDETSSGESSIIKKESPSLVGFEDLGDALANDTDYTFLVKLFVGCAVASYAIKYGELFFDFPFEANVYLGVSVILVPSMLNAFKWYKRSQDPTFEGWF